MYATAFTRLTQITEDPGAAVGATTANIKLTDQFKQSLVFKLTIRHRLVQPRIETAGMQSEDFAHHPNRKLLAVFVDEGVLHSGLLAKYAAAFFRMSRSVVTRLSSAFSRAFSASISGLLASRGMFLPYFFIQSYRLWVVVPSRSATSTTE